MTQSLLIYGILYFSNVLNDILAVMFVQEVTKGNAIRAGLVSVAIVCLSFLSIIYIVSDPIYLIPTAAGAFTGTVFTVGKKT